MQFLRWILAPLLAAALLLYSAPPANACRRAPPRLVAVNDLVQQYENILVQHPEATVQPQYYYMLARLHTLASVCRTEKVYDYGSPAIEFGGGQPVTRGTAISDAEAEAHFAKAMRYFRQIEERYPAYYGLQNGDIHLARGFLLEYSCTDTELAPPGVAAAPLDETATARWTAVLEQTGSACVEDRTAACRSLEAAGATALPVLLANVQHPTLQVRIEIRRLLERLWREKAATDYLRAYTLAGAPDATTGNVRYGPIKLAAGQAYARLVEKRSLSAPEQALVAEIRAQQADFRQQVSGQILYD